MTEEATTIPAVEGTPESAADVWERTVSPAPITKAAVRGDDPKPEPVGLPDRALVTGQLAELYADTTSAPDPILDRLAQLEQSLVPTAEPEHPEVYKELVKLREELAQRDLDAAEAVKTEERDSRLRTVREGFVEALRESDSFPGIVAAGFETKVFETIHAKQQAGEEVSEETILSETEAELWQMYDILHAVKSTTTSDEPTPSETPQTPTLTPTLTATDEASSIEDLMANGGDRQAAAAELWARTVG
jgi:hypothetical protein